MTRIFIFYMLFQKRDFYSKYICINDTMLAKHVFLRSVVVDVKILITNDI